MSKPKTLKMNFKWSKVPKTKAYSTIEETDMLNDLFGLEWDEARQLRELAKVDTGRKKK